MTSLLLLLIAYVKNNYILCGIIAAVIVLLVIIGVVYIKTSSKRKKALNKSAKIDFPDSIAGFAYDQTQNIFYSTKDAWQREFGYCQLYDDFALQAGMIINCEPLRFEYEGKKWLIEIWKGQYGITTGCEIGVYTSDGTCVKIPKIFYGTFYGQTLEEDNLNMELGLIRKNELLFTRKDRHWWLTGFILGDFTKPKDLVMQVEIELKSKEMQDIFVETLKKAGYKENEIYLQGNSVMFIFDKPRSNQPASQVGFFSKIAMLNSRLLCFWFNHITKKLLSDEEKLAFINKKSTRINRSMKIFSSSKISKSYAKIKDYLK